MSASREAVASFRDEDLIELFSRRLPELLERRPDLEPTLFHAFLKTYVLVEIAASVGRTIQTRLERKRRLYEESTGVRPARVTLATASIHSARAHQLRQAGIEVIEPEEPDDLPE